MDRWLSKARILEIYLNVIEWGEGIYGAEAASQYYFQKSAKDLTKGEAAFLGAIIPNPELYAKPSYLRRVERKKRIIMRRM
jgi:monofunctional biosynthetic peptidoglycan transglycosylase